MLLVEAGIVIAQPVVADHCLELLTEATPQMVNADMLVREPGVALVAGPTLPPLLPLLGC